MGDLSIRKIRGRFPILKAVPTIFFPFSTPTGVYKHIITPISNYNTDKIFDLLQELILKTLGKEIEAFAATNIVIGALIFSFHSLPQDDRNLANSQTENQ